jgi:molecular chaperone HtpG
MANSSIDTALNIEDLLLVQHLRKKESPFLRIIEDVFNHAKPYLDSRIPSIFPKYTLHDIQHSLRIIRYMADLVEDLDNLSDLEITLLIVSALLHDIGMAIEQNDLDAIKKDAFDFCQTKYSTMLRLQDNNQVEATQEYIRRIHAQLSARHIRHHMANILTIPHHNTLDFVEEVAQVCQSHTEDFDWIEKNLKHHDVRGDYTFNAQYVAVILRIADILDIDVNRTPYKLYKLIAPDGKSDSEWQQHFVISNNKKIIYNEKMKQKEVVFHGRAKNADLHRKILQYIDWVGQELTAGISAYSKMSDKYALLLHERPVVHIQAEGYTFSGYKMALEFKAISSLLMGEKIYGDKTLGLRELIQNSIDACRIRQEREINEFGDDPYSPQIKILLDEEADQVIIKDNGIGMTLDVIKNHFLNIGVSYYKSFDFRLKDLTYKPIGNYGIGFLSCFMLSNIVKVKTRHYESKNRYTIDLEQGNEWTSLTETEDVAFKGTEVVMNYNQFVKTFNGDATKIREFASRFFITDGIDFKFVERNHPPIQVLNSIKDSLPLEKGLVRIDFDKILSEIDGYAILKTRSKFITSVDQLRLNPKVFLYNPPSQDDKESDNYDEDDWCWLQPIEDSFQISLDTLIHDNILLVANIPIISEADRQDFQEGMKFTNGDLKEVLEKLENKLEWLSVLIPSHLQNSISESEIEFPYDFFDGIPFDHLAKLGQLSDCPTYAFTTEYKLFKGTNDNLYLPFEQADLYPWSRSLKSNKMDLFIRDVLIKDFRFNFSRTASVFEIVSIVANIKSRKFIPDISRNNLDRDGIKYVNDIIGKAIHTLAATELSYLKEEKETITSFIERFYPDVTGFEINQSA